MVRAGEGGYLIDEFKAKNVVAIGWSDLPDLTSTATREALRTLLDQTYSEWSDVRRRIASGTIWKFITEIKVGDSVISYNPTTRSYLIGEVTGEYRRDEDVKDFSNVRPVKWTGSVDRDDLSKSAKRSIGAIQSLFMVSPEVWEEIQRLLNGERPAAPEITLNRKSRKRQKKPMNFQLRQCLRLIPTATKGPCSNC